MTEGRKPILEARDLTKYYDASQGFVASLLGRQRDVKAVDGVDLALREGETLGVVGESGCGKTTLGRTLLRLLEPTDGSVVYRQALGDAEADRVEREQGGPGDGNGGDEFVWADGRPVQREIDLTDISASRLRDLRTDLQYIFQDPFESLNPRLTVDDIVGEPMDIHGIASGKERAAEVRDLLETVGLNPSHAHRYPHEFSGGQRQRIGIARALAVDPEVIICDEPVSALDVSVQAQILNLLDDLQTEFGLSYVFIAHDLSVVEHISDRVAVMYLGEFAEVGTTREVFGPPNHPYAEALLSAIPEPDPGWEGDRIFLPGDVPSPLNPPSGCRFHTRCPRVIQPEEYEMEQDVWRAIMDFKVRLREADSPEGVVVVRDGTDAESADPEQLSRDEFDARVREEFGLPDRIGAPDVEEAVAEVIEVVHEGDVEAASEQIEAALESPCEQTNPALTDRSDSHEIACLLFEEGYDSEMASQYAEAADR